MLNVAPIQQKFIPDNFEIRTWDDIESYMRDLLDRPIDTMADYQRFLEDESELGAVLSEDQSWRYIRVTCKSNDPVAEERFQYFIQHISPKLSEFGDLLNRKIASSPFTPEMPESAFKIVLRGIQTQINLFRTENIPLQVKDEELSTEAGKIRGAMTVTLDGEEMTLPKAGDRLFWQDRVKREEAWTAIRGRYYQDREKLDQIFDDMVKIRDQKAKNANFENYRDYKFASLQRYDYLPESCLLFHDAIEKAVVPLANKLEAHQAKLLQMESLRPWDTAVDPHGRPPLKAFADANDLVEKCIAAFGNMDPVFRDTVILMREQKKLDLESRPNKRPGGYMSQLYQSRVPFVFANVTEKVGDMTTMIHEVGHAVHEIQTRDLRLLSYKQYPIEVAEVASMAMELLSYDQWHIFFPREEDLRRAKYEHLKGVIEFFPWMAQVDAFQHTIYLQPELTPEERHNVFMSLQQRFTPSIIDWSGFENWRRTGWHRQGHIFENPFYYVEYGIAQLGALQIWRNYKTDKKQAIEQYKNALALGYTKSIPEIFETAGIKFDFSIAMLQELMDFAKKELDALE